MKFCTVALYFTNINILKIISTNLIFNLGVIYTVKIIILEIKYGFYKLVNDPLVAIDDLDLALARYSQYCLKIFDRRSVS